MDKKILLVTNIFPPHIGGPASFIDRLAHHLSKLGYRVTVVCSSDRPKEESDRQRAFRVVRVCLANREMYEIWVRLTLFRELLRHRNVVVNGLELYVYQVARILNRRYVLKIVGDIAWETARNRGTTLLDIDQFQASMADQEEYRALVARRNSFARQARVIFTPSKYLRQMVIGWGIDPQRIKVIYNGIEAIDDNCASQARTTKRLKVVFVGRLTNWKGVDTLLLALASLDDVKATIIGDGPEYPHMVDLARQLGLGCKAHFLGRQPEDEVYRTLRTAHAFVLPSLYEGLSHSLLEACSLGVPCIASNSGGNPEIINNGINGLLIPPRDVGALRNALLKLRDDESYRSKLALEAKLRSREFHFGRTVQELEKLINNANQSVE